MRPGTRSPHVDGDAADTFSDRCTAFSRWTAQPGVWRRPEAGAPSTRPGARRKARRDPGPVREDPARVARGPVAILQRAIVSALLTSISSKILHARSTTLASFRWPARPSDIDHGLPKPIRRRRPPFLLRVDARTSAVRSSALAGRERAPMTQATSSSLYRLQTWQHVAEAVHGLQGSHDYCNR